MSTVFNTLTLYNSVSLAWDAPVEGTPGQAAASTLSYQVWRSLTLASGYINIVTTGQAVTTYTDNTVSPSTTYYYYVIAIDPNSEVSLPSNTLTVPTPAPPPPGAPSLSYVLGGGPTPSLVQANSGSVNPGQNSYTFTSTYTNAQTAGNTNVIIVWPGGNTSGAVSSVVDTNGNVYTMLPSFPRLLQGLVSNLSIFTCVLGSNHPPGNTVTVTQTISDSGGELAILEYTNIASSPIDAWSSNGDASGTTLIGDSPITTINPADLLISGFIGDINFVNLLLPAAVTPPTGWNLATTASLGLPTTGGTTFVADRQVYAAGTYDATWTQGPPLNLNTGYTGNQWGIWTLGLKSTLTSPPTTTTVSLSWNSVSTATSYNIYYGTTNNGPYPNKITLGNVTSYTVSGLSSGTYYFVSTAQNSSGEGSNSNQITATVSGTGSGHITPNATSNSNMNVNNNTIRTIFRMLRGIATNKGY